MKINKGKKKDRQMNYKTILQNKSWQIFSFFVFCFANYY